ncbi:hypothetical protein CSW98_02805 [Vibrio sp. HA2012]|uniref:HlyD family secretion protein n=1 Tax=Vibrio sp. HA2012 TaxID=1971595 RepID=UPI000C2B95F7|nr:biotin/lipoyl-binding protein [Vibrio sp. HA2012]PJC88065.1 hypothetical protein CSW98_02805 [Vibrio sp. HA2012]
MFRLPATIIALLILFGCNNQHPVQALGTIERDRVTFTATSGEIITALPFKEGSQIKTGDVLAQLDTQKQRALLTRAEAEQVKAQAYLNRLHHGERTEDIAAANAQIDLARAVLTENEKAYQRMQYLVEQKLASPSQADTALAARDSAKARLKSAKETYTKLQSGSRPEDIQQAEAALAAARADVTYQQHRLNELTVTATRNGILDSLPFHLGERVPQGGCIAIMQVSSIPYARVYIPETYIAHLHPGDRLSVHVDGIDKIFSGTVRTIATAPAFTPYYALTEKERSRLMYLAEIDLSEEAKNLPSGVPAQADLPARAAYE